MVPTHVIELVLQVDNTFGLNSGALERCCADNRYPGGERCNECACGFVWHVSTTATL